MIMAASVSTTGLGKMAINITGVAATTDGAIGAVLNPEGVDVLITRCILYVGTQSTGAANLSCGVAATATTAASDIINALAVGGATGKYYNGQAVQVTAKTEVSAPAVWSAGKYINFTGSASTAGLVGTLYVEYVRVS
jgi:hypothetical protein